jgi:cyanophycinase-like exopeptidase
MPKMLVIMGSGETSPTMVATHQQLLSRLPASSRAVLVETPYGFQENADEISRRTMEYFRHNVGRDIDVVGLRTAHDADGPGGATAIARLREADYVFAGPGSPTYALEQWRGSAFADVLARKLRTGGIVVFASAAAVGLGRAAVPVYEIYKVGRPPHWVDGLDLLGAVGIDAAVIPHFDNAEGGTHDTRFCYLGARRLGHMEEMLAPGTAVLGVDEHTALLLDVDAGTATVTGRGAVTVRRDGHQLRSVSAGTTVTIAALLHGGPIDANGAGPAAASPGPASSAAAAPADTRTLAEQVAEDAEAFDQALAARDADAAVAAILDAEAAIARWSADTLQSDEADRARGVLRGMIVRLGQAADEGLVDPAQRLGPLADAVVRARGVLRDRREYALADELRDLAADAGVELRDTGDGTVWSVVSA